MGTKTAIREDCCQAFADSYDLSSLPAMRAVEREVLGCDFGGTSWTTSAQAADIARALDLDPGSHLLDVGAGSGWPGLYLAGTTGCCVTLVDRPENALAIALDRARSDGVSERVSAVSACATSMPFTDGTFDAISHSDLLCCLPEKRRALAECRRVASPAARMHFSVIAVPPQLAGADRQAAIDAGPPYVDADAPYAALLAESRWHVLERRDVTVEFRLALDRLVAGLEGNNELEKSLGRDAVAEACDRRRQQIALIDRGHLVRETWHVTPGS